jgi:hypothetical protein
MGITHAVCNATSLGIRNEPVYVLLVAQAGDTFAPVALPIYGEYDSYGSIEKPGLTPTDLPILRGFVAMRASGELALPDPHELGDAISVENLRALLEDVRQGSIFEEVRPSDAPPLLVRARGLSLGFVFILEEVYDALVSIALKAAGDERVDALTDGGLSALVAAAFGASELAPRLIDDSHQVRNAHIDFVLFRERFGSRCSWKPAAVGHQFTRAELRKRVAHARAAWPELAQVIDRYDKRAS